MAVDFIKRASIILHIWNNKSWIPSQFDKFFVVIESQKCNFRKPAILDADEYNESTAFHDCLHGPLKVWKPKIGLYRDLDLLEFYSFQLILFFLVFFASTYLDF